MGLQRRFPEFDVDGKGIYLDKARESGGDGV